MAITIGTIGGAWACGDDDPPASELDGGADAAPLLDGSSDETSVEPDDGGRGEVDCGELAPSECVVQLGGGYEFACALFLDGHVRCWGGNFHGQAATGEIVDGGGYDIVTPETVFPPVAIPGLHDVRQIALQSRTACALDDEGRVFCWGTNDVANTGQPPTVAIVVTPTRVPSLPPAKKLLPNARSMCAEVEDGQVWCWGSNTSGQLGVIEGADGGVIAPPVRVPVFEGAIVGAGGNAYYAVQADGGVLSLGINNFGMLGRGVGDDVLKFDPHPAPVVGLPERAIAVGRVAGAFQCAILESGAIACWGDNRSTQIAPDASDAHLTPTVVDGLGGVVEVAGGYNHACARLVDGGVSCWGHNLSGAVGQSSAGYYPPTHVEGLGPTVQVVASGRPFSCALEVGGVAKCWGPVDRYNAVGRPLDAGVDFHVPFPVAF